LGPRNNNKMHYQHLALRTPDASADLRTSSSWPATPPSPLSGPSGSLASSPLDDSSATPVLQTADVLTYHHHITSTTRPSHPKASVAGVELEYTSIDDEWDYTMSALASSPGRASPSVDFHRPHSSSHSAYCPPVVVSDMVCHPHHAVPRIDVQEHPWVRLPFLASAQLLDFHVDDHHSPHLRHLAIFVGTCSSAKYLPSLGYWART
jgi:hypothetical protein